MSATAEAIQQSGIKRERKRNASLKIDKKKIVQRIIRYYEDDIADRAEFLDRRIQLYAKYRMWTERDDLPWEGASDIPYPDMMSDSLRLQDTLHNAVLSVMPPITSKAMNPEEKEKQDVVDNLITHQLFNEHNGNDMVGDMAESFINDGFFVVFVPWVKESQKNIDLRQFPDIPDEMLPKQYFEQILQQEFSKPYTNINDWDFVVSDDVTTRVSFYTNETGIEMLIEKMELVFDGPKPIVKDVDEVLFPWRAANLQIPGPSNPGGASHVILIDYPTVDEVRKLQKEKYYDLVKSEDIDEMEKSAISLQDQEMKEQKDVFQGTEFLNKGEVASHNQITRLICFDRVDIDNDGLDEDVIVWVCKETQKILKIRRLSELFPAFPPRRPLISKSMIPVKGRVIGISLLEMMEGLHDAAKETLDHLNDSGTLESSPFFFYKSTSSLNPENFHLGPGDGIAVGNPKDDIFFPSIGNQGQSFGFNFMTILGQMSDKLTMVSDLQRGQIPNGQSSALRTTANMAQIISQGESRPERILRRFFDGLSEIYHQVHELNQRLLPEQKKIMISGNLDPDMDPYQTVSDKAKIRGRFQFTFSANILNTSKAALQQSLSAVMNMIASPLAIQLQLTDQQKLYRLFKNLIKAYGQDPMDYINKPTPDADRQLITTEQAMISILKGVIPGGVPSNGYLQHLQEMAAFSEGPEFATLNNDQIQIYALYLEQIKPKAQEEMMRMQQAQAARDFQVAQQQTQGGGENPRQQLSPNEKYNESLT